MTTDVRLTADPIDPAALLRDMTGQLSGAGAIVTFCGLVRPEAKDGASVAALRLDHHPRLTLRSLQDIAADGLARFALSSVTVVHRHGSIEPGAVVVFVGAAAAHRRAAFLGADYLMDRLKSEAVFWKKEEGPDGGRWIEPTEADRADLRRWENEGF